MRCVILGDNQNIALKVANCPPIDNKVETITFNKHFENESELIDAIKEFEIVIIMCERTLFSASVFERRPRLKLVITSEIINTSIDLAAAPKYGIQVCGTQSFSEPPAELTWALISGLARQIVAENKALTNNHMWQNSLGVGLKGKQLGILG